MATSRVSPATPILQRPPRRPDPREYSERGRTLPGWLGVWQSQGRQLRPFVLAMAGACTLAVVLIGVGQAAGIALDYALGRYPGSARLAGQRLQLRALPGGYLRHDGAYRTSDNLTTIVAWYSGRSGIEPGPSMYADGRCVKLSQVNRHSLFQHALAVTICAAQHSTSVYVSQTAAVIPFAPARRQ